MKLKPLFVSKKSVAILLRSARVGSSFTTSSHGRNGFTLTSPTCPSFIQRHLCGFSALRNPKFPETHNFLNRCIHSLQEVKPVDSEEEMGESDHDDGPMSEFLSRFTWIMRGKLSEVYADCDKKTIDGMLLLIVEKVVSELEKGGPEEMLDGGSSPSQDFSEDLWKTVWEVSNMVLEGMNKEKKKEAMKRFLQSEDVKEMTRFATEVGIRGDMLREFKFKWAREKMEESEFYESLELLREQDRAQEEEKEAKDMDNTGEGAVREPSNVIVEEKPKIVSLPQRRGKIKYTIYGLDMSDSKWLEVADKIHEAEKLITPEEPKPITGKCKLVTEKILSLSEKDDPSQLLAEWVELLQPNKIDWLNFLDRLGETNSDLCFKIAELVLDEESFQTNIRDYSKLIDAHAKVKRLEDAERILKKMTDKGIQPDILTSTILVHMYSNTGNLERAKEAFEGLKSQGFQPDMRTYNSMIMAYVNSDQAESGESLAREMEAREIKPTKEIFMELLRSYSKRGLIDSAQQIATNMQFAGISPSLESCTLLVEAYSKFGDPDQARHNFDYMIRLGIKPDDRCAASMFAVYEKKNLLDKALSLLFQLKADGFEPGVETYAVLVDWMGKLQLLDEAEELLGKITSKSDSLPLKVQVSLCDMYARAGIEKKALQALGILEGKKDLLDGAQFGRIIEGLLSGGLVQDAKRLLHVMESRGFPAPETLKISDAFRPQRPIR